jgi:hypothetical protein
MFCSKFNESLYMIDDVVQATMEPFILAPPRATHHRGGQPNLFILREMVRWQGAFVRQRRGTLD